MKYSKYISSARIDWQKYIRIAFGISWKIEELVTLPTQLTIKTTAEFLVLSLADTIQQSDAKCHLWQWNEWNSTWTEELW